MTRAPQIGVLALQGDVREHMIALTSVGAGAQAVREVDELNDIDALIIPGGESTTMSKLAIRDGFLEPLRDKAASGMPMYGSCAGMIMLATSVLDGRADQQTIGAMDVTVRRNAFGSQVDSFEDSIVIDALGQEPFPCVFIRAPWIERVGPQVEILGHVATADGADRIVAVRSGTMLATSFHPELTDDLRVHEYFVDLVRSSMKDGV